MSPLRSLTIAALALAALPLRAEVTAIAPVFDQLVAIPLPTGFGSGHDNLRGDNFIQEFVPEGESVADNWTQMITLTGTRGAANVPVAHVGDLMTAGFGAACPGTLTAVDLGPLMVGGSSAAQAWYLGCGHVTTNPPSRREEMVIVVLQGSADLYTVQWAARGPAQASAPAYDAALWGPRLATLAAQMRLCPILSAEGPPYPSCTSG